MYSNEIFNGLKDSLESSRPNIRRIKKRTLFYEEGWIFRG